MAKQYMICALGTTDNLAMWRLGLTRVKAGSYVDLKL